MHTFAPARSSLYSHSSISLHFQQQQGSNSSVLTWIPCPCAAVSGLSSLLVQLLLLSCRHVWPLQHAVSALSRWQSP
jgi:hypothetical protein